MGKRSDEAAVVLRIVEILDELPDSARRRVIAAVANLVAGNTKDGKHADIVSVGDDRRPAKKRRIAKKRR